MTELESLLWERITKFELDDQAVAFKFSDRLARENGWTIAYARRVIREYKKFIFLCCISKQGITPSDPVDQAWHLHLTYTRSYWIDLCKNTLQKDIHHHPTKGGEQEANKFDGYYTSSHKLYKESFGVEPPADIWQNNHDRFSDINFKRVNVGEYWLIRKPTKRRLMPFVLILVCIVFIQASSTDWFSVIGVGIFAVAAIRNAIIQNRKGKKSENGGGCDGGGFDDTDNNHHHSDSSHNHSDSGCNSGCSGCSGSGCSGCGGGGD